jgi:hypothetical protein
MASCKFDLVENGVESLDEAFADVEHALHVIAPCSCELDILRAWERADRERALRARGLNVKARRP